MSSALVRQALEFVDQEERVGRRAGRRGERRRAGGAKPEHSQPYSRRTKKAVPESKPVEQQVEDNVKKLLALSRHTTDTKIAQKIVERAVKGKPLLEKIEVKKEEEKSILFPEEESFKKFEKEYFCS